MNWVSTCVPLSYSVRPSLAPLDCVDAGKARVCAFVNTILNTNSSIITALHTAAAHGMAHPPQFRCSVVALI